MQINYDQAVKILDDLRQATREARECLKDFKQMQRDYQQLIDNWADRVNRQIADDVSKGLEAYKSALDTAMKEATDRVFARFDKLSAIIMGENQKGIMPTIPELIQQKYGKD